MVPLDNLVPIFVAGVVVFGSVYAIKEYFDIYFERQEVKARLELLNEIESHSMINEVNKQAEGKKLFKNE